MNKMSSNMCLECVNYDTCSEYTSPCTGYEYYKCKHCKDMVESDGLHKCYRGGLQCSQVRFCNNYHPHSNV